MVSTLWKACSEGNLENVHELLKEASSVDIETKDHTGVTPLIEAVKNGHVEVVRALLEKGADPTNASSQGPPETYTTDSVILELLETAKGKLNSNAAPAQEPLYSHDQNMDPTKGYYGPPPGAYYYPGVPIGAPMMPDGSVAYYPPPPAPISSDQNAGAMSNLPPPEVARMIPCRYYPACRYGSSCMFAHPQAPYLQGPLPPPAQYPAPYDPMAPSPYPPPTYYPAPPSFLPPTNGAHMEVMSPPPGAHQIPPSMVHTRSGSEIISPVQAPFSPTGAPPMPYGVPPMSPTFALPGQMPIPVSIPPLSPPQHPAGGPQSPQQSMYPVSPSAHPIPSYPHPEAVGPYPPHGMHPNGMVANGIGSPTSPSAHPQADGYGHGPMNRDGMAHHRRGSARRPSFGASGRKPPCIFFPLGKCRNGAECRFPHVLPEVTASYQHHHHPPPHFAPRGGHRPRPSGHAHMNGVNGPNGVEERFAGMGIQDHDRQPSHVRNNTNGTSATTASSRSQSSDPGSRRGPPGYKLNHIPNGARPDKKFLPSKPQRVPSADEFPTLSSTTPPLRSPAIQGTGANGWSGPTAAQVLQAPPPPRKESQPDPRGNSPEQKEASLDLKDAKPEVSSSPAELPVSKLPVSFAAAAAAAAAAASVAATAAPDAAKEVTVTA